MQKTVQPWSQIIQFENLWNSFLSASKGKQLKHEVADFSQNAESNLLRLKNLLELQTYRPNGYRSFEIHDPKRRLVSAAPFQDRVVHHALVRVIEPVFNQAFIHNSYANRVGKGAHAAIQKAFTFSKRYAYVLQCDLRQYFPSIDHHVLLSILKRRINCERTLDLCKKILAGGADELTDEYDMVYFKNDDLFALGRPRGLPIGNLTSQFWANVYLNELDQKITGSLGCKAYLRYVDDFLLFSNDKAQLWSYKREIRQILNGLRLTMHEASSTVFPTKNGIGFLGMRITDQDAQCPRF
jgi:RNA-directed DNA polymerase